MRATSRAFLKHAVSPLTSIATLTIGLAAVALVSRPVSRLPELNPSFNQVKWPSHPAVAEPVPQIELKEAVSHEPRVVQSFIIHFPVHGAVRVKSIEQIGKFPKIVFSDVKSGRILFQSSTRDRDGWLKPTDDEFTQPFLRFREVRSPGFRTPLVMAVAVRPGGSDDAFYLTVFGEVNGKISRLVTPPIYTNVQGGFYLGYLNRRLGYGLVSWCFVWDESEIHYDSHHYSMEVYSLQDGKFRKVISSVSKRKYHPPNAYRALRELGINARDLRRTLPIMKEWVDVDD